MFEYWNKKPKVIKGEESKFSALPSSKLLPSMCAGEIREGTWIENSNLSAHASIVNKYGEINQLNDVPFTMFPQLFNSGYSFCFRDVSNTNSELRELVADVSRLCSLYTNTSITCYITPPNSNGILHYDSQHVFFLQREGTKYWRVAEKPAIKNPVENFLYPTSSQEYLNEMNSKGYNIAIPSECGFEDIKLEEGDLLYMPPGFYHAPHTKSDTSFHYTLTLNSLSFWNMVMSSLHLTLLENCSNYNNDVRMLDQEAREEYLNLQLQKFKKQVSSLNAKDIMRVFTK
jgi:ribosomal protein L16 Arg81 hydroxylase